MLGIPFFLYRRDLEALQLLDSEKFASDFSLPFEILSPLHSTDSGFVSITRKFIKMKFYIFFILIF